MAFIYPAIMRYSYQNELEKFSTLGRLFDDKLNRVDENKAAVKSNNALEDFIKEIGVLTCFDGLNIMDEVFKLLK